MVSEYRPGCGNYPARWMLLSLEESGVLPPHSKAADAAETSKCIR
ncbi:MAG: hypothetical protein AB1611_14930 [bacterium]